MHQRSTDHRCQRQETVAAIREGLADADAGHTKAARAAIRALAKKYGIPLPEESR